MQILHFYYKNLRQLVGNMNRNINENKRIDRQSNIFHDACYYTCSPESVRPTLNFFTPCRLMGSKINTVISNEYTQIKMPIIVD